MRDDKVVAVGSTFVDSLARSEKSIWQIFFHVGLIYE